MARKCVYFKLQELLETCNVFAILELELVSKSFRNYVFGNTHCFHIFGMVSDVDNYQPLC